MSQTMLVRTTTGAWERLEAQTKVPDGGITEIFGEDVGPVLGYEAPLIVVAASPKLATGKPDAICVDAQGAVTIVALSLGSGTDKTLPQLLSFAGALHGMTYDAFEKLCNRTDSGASLAEHIHARNIHADFHTGTFEVTVADALSQGRFQLISLVESVSPSLAQSMRYINASGANFGCFEISSFSSSSVMAVQARAVDVGQQKRDVQLRMTAAGLIALTERTTDESTAKLMGNLQKFCSGAFDEVAYEGDNKRASLTATFFAGQEELPIITAASDGSISISFEALAPVDKDWTLRAELCQSMSRLLGAELGDVRKISQLNLSLSEHLNDATLMDAMAEIVGDVLSTLRPAGTTVPTRNGAMQPSAA